MPPEQPDFLSAYRSGLFSEAFPLDPGDTGAALMLPRPGERADLVRALRRQADRFGAPDAARRNLERLADPAARAVVTGQQTGLLLGPNYTLSKAVTALRLAARLDAPDRPVVPVFWMASQDHDAAEVDHAHLLGMDERLRTVRVRLPPDAPTGAIPWTSDWLEAVLGAFEAVDAAPVHREEARGLVSRAAEGAGSFADWFGRLLSELLGPAGLVLLDPLDPAIALRSRPVLEAEMEAPDASAAAVRNAGQRLRQLGYAPQLGRAEGATNLFLTERFAGGARRVLLRRANGSFRTDDHAYSVGDLRALLDEDPTAITPAAALRPITQDVVLPTAVTVVGPGELRYFAQLRGVYELHDVAMPLVWPRATATVLEPPVRRILAEHSIEPAAYLGAPAAHRQRAVLMRNDAFDRFEAALRALDGDVRALHRWVSAVDPTLRGTVERTSDAVERAVETLRAKTAAALARADATTRRQFDRLEAHLLPRGEPQERVLSPFSHFLKFGVEPVVAAFLSIEPEGDHFVEL